MRLYQVIFSVPDNFVSDNAKLTIAYPETISLVSENFISPPNSFINDSLVVGVAEDAPVADSVENTEAAEVGSREVEEDGYNEQ